jgi:GTP cyclohydrolase I
MSEPRKPNMPDVASGNSNARGTLDLVGMGDIRLPVRILSQAGYTQTVSAHAQAYVSLDKEDAKGIHMSRLYLAVDRFSETASIDPASLDRLLKEFLETHQGLSETARISFRFELPLRRASLKSGQTGWKSYPCQIVATRKARETTHELQVDIPYSSTCPCSAALARQLIQNNFMARFGEGTLDARDVVQWLGTEQGINATPHSQRSVARVRVKLPAGQNGYPVRHLVDLVEKALGTPVQATVKREDEQEFARLNAANLMFCEDAARRVQNAMLRDNCMDDWFIRVTHLESLHDHDAVSVKVRGVAAGYQPDIWD